MSQPFVYSLIDYGAMIDCEPRMGVYAEALRRAVTPGCTVIDLGAGFGMFSLLACKYGAGHVIAIEPDPNIELLRPLAQANGYANRITILRDISTRYTPERKADVIVSDCRGTMPLFDHHIATIKDARERLLAPGGTLLPLRDTIKVALANSSSTYRQWQKPWRRNDYGLDLSAAHASAINSEGKAHLGASVLASTPQDLAVIDYRTVTEPNLDSTVELVASKDAKMHGLLVWFDAEIAEGLGYSNAPGQPPLVYGQMFLPFANPPRLKAGDRVTARIRGNLVHNRYIWSWEGSVIDHLTGAARGHFRQSSFLGPAIARDALKARSNLLVPHRTPMMQIDSDCLAMVDGSVDQDGIAKALLDRYPEHFSTYRAALDHVVSLMLRYSGD
jgi:protein arginine N-methyltransferase 1